MTNNFSLKEFVFSEKAIDLKIDNSPPSSLLLKINFTLCGMERIRAALENRPINITSGYRCEKLNNLVGGSRLSQHLTGQACDFVCPSFGDPREVFEKIKPLVYILGVDQLILEPSWVHVSFSLLPRYQVFSLVGHP